jgi:hypothetical protein
MSTGTFVQVFLLAGSVPPGQLERGRAGWAIVRGDTGVESVQSHRF